MLHGDGSPTRRYLYAGDAADAFDTILHKGVVNQIYNVGSNDEISNMTLCHKLLTYLNIPHKTHEQLQQWVKHTQDRPFNDHRYAVDGTKLRQLGWDQKTSFADGLAITVDWYGRFGETWWGDITQVLTPFPAKRQKETAGEIHDWESPPKRKAGDDGVLLPTATSINIQGTTMAKGWDVLESAIENGEGPLAKRRKMMGPANGVCC